MTSDQAAALLETAVAALYAGDRRSARIYLTQVLALEPYHEHALLWLSGAVELPEQQIACLERVLAINPYNHAAIRGLAQLRGSVVTPVVAEPELAPWNPPEPLSLSQLAELPVSCYACDAQLYASATFCWRCHVAVRCCANCIFRPYTECKVEQAIQSEQSPNCCPWWRPI
ncbi:tetratricopeptide repeat protein [Herpetosiphon sp. NSE202]|uniref:tetratricopeptide repeat protein n=1 Tax=Herpetosiphon sp. NSE202 TaxID=3351349 RepID=UPI00362BD257